MAAMDFGLIAAITAPHLLYACIWMLPNVWRRLFRNSVHAFSCAASALKVVQIAVVLYWGHERLKLEGRQLALERIPLLDWAAFFMLVFLGQVLNVAVFRALGEEGVYYGSKLGRKVAWQRGFPFNISIKHPQYVGAVMTIWGCSVLVWRQAPGGMLTLTLYWTLLYVATALWEDLL